MRNQDTITCAVTNGAGCAVPSTASVFRAVDQAGFTTERCQREINHGGCERTCGETARRVCANAWNRGNCCANESNWDCAEDCSREPRSVCNQNNCHRSGCNHHCQCNEQAAADTTDCSCTAGQRKCKGNTPAMVYEAQHHLCNLHDIEEAIRKGTLFPQLYMPMNGECADACGANLCEGQAEAFAAWELRLYLNTHPCDEQALQLFWKMARKAGEPNYAGTFLEGCQSRWNWTDAPWPWEFNCGCE